MAVVADAPITDADLEDVDEAELVDDLVDEPAINLEVFAEELERMMVAGHSSVSIARWAMTQYSISGDELDHVKKLVLRSWALESQSAALANARRNDLRRKYMEVYEDAMASEKYIAAIKALDSVSKLDGLTQDVNLTQVNINPGRQNDQHQITNGVRERIQQLSEQMRLRSEQRGKLLQSVDAKVKVVK